MLRSSRAIAFAACCALGVAVTGCRDFLTSGEAGANPNVPADASKDQLFVGVQAGQFAWQEGAVAQFVCEIMQQCAGVGGRFVQTRGRYGFAEGDFDFDFTNIYTGGGLVDIRKVQAGADSASDRVYKGIAEVWEALIAGTAADIWGDIPYREAVTDNVAPALDPQAQVYADIQALLDRAIQDIGGTGTGPGPLDLVYEGNKTKWVQAARTLKARHFLHTVERPGNQVDRAAYQNALNAAQGGISSSANDFRAYHSSATSERNVWFQFGTTSFGSDLVAGAFLVNLMNARNDPRRSLYFSRNRGGGFGGVDVNAATPADSVSQVTETPGLVPGTSYGFDPAFRQPIVTWVENQLILAEANLVLNGQGAAQPFLDAVRTSIGLGSVPATLENIITEKYIALFQNIEVWNDYKRTCFPRIRPFPTTIFSNQVPGRLYYGQAEQNANPSIPDVATQRATNGFRNANDPNPCPAVG